jgi:uncharacterized protein
MTKPPLPSSDTWSSPTSLPSPCVQLCIIEPLSGLCEGCGRSLAEIGRWAGMSQNEQRTVLKQLGSRLRRLRAFLRDHEDAASPDPGEP